MSPKISTKVMLAAAAASIGLGGCGSSGGGHSDGGPDAVTAAQACADLASARCNERSMCSSRAGGNGPGVSVIRTYGDLATCIARETLSCQNGLAAAQTGSTPGGIETCVADFPTYACIDFFDNNPPAGCVATGGRANGVPCAFNGQCASQYCRGTKNNACGACADPPTPGADCSLSGCWHSQNCIGSTMTCAAVVSLNGACDGSHPCDNGLACVGASSTAMGTCQTAGTRVGAACGGSMGGCDVTLGLYCAGATGAKTCAAMTYVGDGQACGAMQDGSRVGCAAGDCYTATGTTGASETGTCKASVDAPGACDTVLGPSCLAPARCVVDADAGSAGTCVVPTGDMCPAS
jgi:hypothetical protein